MNRLIAGGTLLAALGCSAPSDSPTSPVAVSKSAQFARGPMGVIVTVSGDPLAIAKAHGIAPRFVFRHALNGFAALIPDLARAKLMRDVRVKHVATDGKVFLAATQTPAPQHLDLIDQRTAILNNSYSYDRTGLGVDVFFIDTGINSSHVEFFGRIGSCADFSGSGTCADSLGHGTAVAALAGGITLGVAKGITLHAFKVFDSTGSTDESIVIAAVDSITAIHPSPAVVNMSIEGPLFPALNIAVQNSIASGISYAIAAGNGNVDACTISPASVVTAVTVSKAHLANGILKKSFQANYGNCVDLFAPGDAHSAWIGSDTATMDLSGTSMSTPLVAGVMAMYLEGRPSASPAEVQDSIKAFATKGVVQSASTPNCSFLFSGRSVQGGHIPNCRK